jgi:histidinol-phosphatase (PHP family)
MLLTNYHTHTQFCDGQGSPEQVLQTANKAGFAALGFSAHAPLPFANDFTLPEQDLQPYIAAVNALKGSCSTEVYLGLEIDYIPGMMAPTDKKWQSLALDYCLGSVHTLAAPDENYPMLSVDGPLEEFDLLLDEVYQGNARKMIETYYQRISELCSLGGFDILGHYDLIKKHNRQRQFFSEQASWYRDVAISTLDDVAKSGVIMEVNFGGMLRGATDDIYPPRWLLKEACRRQIPVQINADAHHPDHLAVHQEYCRDALLKAGYTSQRILQSERWQDVEL